MQVNYTCNICIAHVSCAAVFRSVSYRVLSISQCLFLVKEPFQVLEHPLAHNTPCQITALSLIRQASQIQTTFPSPTWLHFKKLLYILNETSGLAVKIIRYIVENVSLFILCAGPKFQELLHQNENRQFFFLKSDEEEKEQENTR